MYQQEIVEGKAYVGEDDSVRVVQALYQPRDGRRPHEVHVDWIRLEETGHAAVDDGCCLLRTFARWAVAEITVSEERLAATRARHQLE